MVYSLEQSKKAIPIAKGTEYLLMDFRLVSTRKSNKKQAIMLANVTT